MLLLFKLTVSPLRSAGELNTTVHLSLAAPVMEVLLQDRLWIWAAETNGYSSPNTNKLFISSFFLADSPSIDHQTYTAVTSHSDVS